jgi:hypothetical protein
MPGVILVRQVDRTRLQWDSSFLGKRLERDIAVTVWDFAKRIAWKSVRGSAYMGSVRLQWLGDDTTLLSFEMGYESNDGQETSQSIDEQVVTHVETTVRQFKQFIEGRDCLVEREHAEQNSSG